MGLNNSTQHKQQQHATSYVVTSLNVDRPKNLEAASVIAPTSIMQPTEETPAQMIAKVDFLLRQKVRHIEILAADTLQLPNIPLIIFLQDLKKLSDQKSKPSETELDTQYAKAVEKFKNNVEKVKKHFIGFKTLIGMLNTLNSDTLSQVCKDKGILLADDELMTVLSEAGKSWSQEVRKALEERFDRKVVDCFISFKTWGHYQGNPWGEEKAQKRFIQYLKYLQSVQTRFNSEEFSSCKHSVNQHAAVVSIERYKEIINQYINLIQLIKSTETDGATSWSTQSIQYGTEIGKAFKENRKKLESGDTTSTSFLSDHKDAFAAYASVTGYDIQTAIELSELYLLSELAVFDMFRSRCRVAQQDAAIKSVDVIAYNGPMTPSVAAYYKTRNLTHLEGRDTPVLQWLALQYQIHRPSEKSGAFGQSAKDTYFDKSVSKKATKLLEAQPAQKRGGFIMSYGNHNSVGKAQEESDLVDLEQLRNLATKSFVDGFNAAAAFAFFGKKKDNKNNKGNNGLQRVIATSDPIPISSSSRSRSNSGDSIGDPSPSSSPSHSPRTSLTALPSLEKQGSGDHREKPESNDMPDSQISPPSGGADYYTALNP